MASSANASRSFSQDAGSVFVCSQRFVREFLAIPYSPVLFVFLFNFTQLTQAKWHLMPSVMNVRVSVCESLLCEYVCVCMCSFTIALVRCV